MTRELTSQLGEVENMSVGLANFFIQHTSASLTMSGSYTLVWFVLELDCH